jgi:GT2 family glycosyltransferase
VVGGAIRLEADSYWVLCDNLLSFSDALVTAQAGARPYLASFCLGVQRKAFEVAGGFDESYPGAAGEDIDLSLRLRQQGWELYFDPTVQVTHRPARSSAWAMWQHQRGFGRGYYRVVYQKRTALVSPLLNLSVHLLPMFRVLAPLLSCKDILQLFLQNPELRTWFWAYAGLVWGRTGWYIGALEH